MRSVKLAMIGCGGIAGLHLRWLKDIPEARVVAVCDVVRERAEARRAELLEGKRRVIKVFDKPADVFKWGGFDGVIILTPHTLHYEQALAALKKGKHVILEKPMVCKVSHARELLKLSQQKGLALVVSYQRHYHGVWRYGREVIRKGELGKITAINGWLSQHWLENVRLRWRSDPELSGGGQLNDSGSHLLAASLWMTGLQPQEVFGFVENRGLRVDVTSSFSVSFKGGAVGGFTILGDSVRGMQEELVIWGDQGTLYFEPERVKHLKPNGCLVRVRKLPASSNPERNFIDAILGRDQVHSGAEVGLAVTRLTAGIYRAARTGKPARV